MTHLYKKLALIALFGTVCFSDVSVAGDNLYVEGQLGLNLPRNSSADGETSGFSESLPFDFENNVLLSGAVGYHVLPQLRVEGEIGYRKSDADFTGSTSVTALDNALTTKVTTFMVNGWYDIPTATKWTPYVGGGLGFAKISNKTDSASVIQADDSDTVFAYQLGGGVGYDLGDNMTLTAGYRYLDTANAEFEATVTGFGAGTIQDDFSSHELRAGLRYDF